MSFSATTDPEAVRAARGSDSDVLVEVEGVSKKFCRDLRRSLWYGVCDSLAEFSLTGRQSNGTGPRKPLRKDEFWAVNDVSFQLRRGECLGLIGRNGAGKTTLLKMLNGLIKPDAGAITMRGRVGALIALGAGFNPILTGRENIYVNASVLGLSRKEIDGKIDEIIDFAEIPEFIDTPVQNYSSGMQVRLGFAIATALDPDVLILDEVLAVGDAAFRAKCYQRMSSLSARCATIFVSHSMDHIAQVCSQGLVMQGGHVACLGSVIQAIDQYKKLNIASSKGLEEAEHLAPGVRLASMKTSQQVKYGGVISVALQLHLSRSVASADVRISLFNENQQLAMDSYTKVAGASFALHSGLNVVKLDLSPCFLVSGQYVMSIALLDQSTNEHLYWGSRIRRVQVDGPVGGIGVACPPLTINTFSLETGLTDV